MQYSHLTRFKEHCPDFPKGELEYGDDPDLIVHTPDGLLGIEHTRIFRPDRTDQIVPQEQESLEERIVNLARERYESRGGPPVTVTPYFNPHIRLGKKDVDPIAERLCDIVCRYLPATDGQVILETYHLGLQVLPTEIWAVIINRYPGFKEMFWGAARSGVVPDLEPDYLDEIIRNKETRRQKYLKRCSHIWLLIVEDGSAPSSYFTITDSAISRTYKSGFDRVFLFNNFDCKVIELKLDSPSSVEGCPSDLPSRLF